MDKNERIYHQRYDAAMEVLGNQFKHHPPPDENTAETHKAVRAAFLHMSCYVAAVAVESSERTKALDALREAMFWTNSAVAIHGVASTPDLDVIIP